MSKRLIDANALEGWYYADGDLVIGVDSIDNAPTIEPKLLTAYQDTGFTPEQITAIQQKIIQIENRLGESLLKSRTKNEYAESDVINNMLDVIYEIRSAYEK